MTRKIERDGWKQFTVEYNVVEKGVIKYETGWIDELPEQVKKAYVNALIHSLKEVRLEIF